MMSVRVSGGVRMPLESVRVFAVGVKVSGVRVFGGSTGVFAECEGL